MGKIHPLLSSESQEIFDKALKANIIRINEKNGYYEVWKNNIKLNLSLQEYLLTESSKFHSWSHNTHLTDNLGQPLVVRHGSYQSFDKFHNNQQGIYFCNFLYAIQYAKTRREQETGGIVQGKQKPTLYQCCIKANKLYICNKEKYWDIATSLIREQGYDGIIAYNTRDSHGIYDQYIVKSPEQIFTLQTL